MVAEPGSDEKICNCCGLNKKLSEFAKHCRSRDGHKSTCKSCIKEKSLETAEERRARDREKYRQNPEKYREASKEYQRNNREKVREQKRKYASKNREKLLSKNRAYNKSHPELKRKRYTAYPEKSKARMLLAHAIRDGCIKREPCEICGDIKSEGHHDDYSKPLDVVWLCRKHHCERHIEIREQEDNDEK